MRILLMALVSVARLPAQVGLTDPEYIIPRENPFTGTDDLKRGEQLFLSQCAGCHGPKGEGGRGAVLAQPRLRHAADDASLFELIRDGIKGTEMPAGSALTTRETWQAAAYVRSLGRLAPEAVPGDAGRGREIYRTKGNCGRCHIVNGEGGSLGPELSEIGTVRSASHLRAAVLDPETEIPKGFLQLSLVTRDGRRITGVRLNEDTFTIQVRDLNGRIYSFVKQDLKELQRDTGKSPMPRFREVLSMAETDDLVGYLVSLRGKP